MAVQQEKEMKGTHPYHDLEGSDEVAQPMYDTSRPARSKLVKMAMILGLPALGCVLLLLSGRAGAFSNCFQGHRGMSGPTASSTATVRLSRPATATIKTRAASALAPYALPPLPLGSIKPQGWLLSELQSMADGLAGHQQEFYPIVSDSRWTGGQTDYSDLNEGIPYWLNGAVPLAYALGDQRLLGQIDNIVTYILEHQDAAGWLGPEKTYDSNNLWGRFLVMLSFMQIAQADAAMAARVIPPMHRFVKLMNTIIMDGKSNDEVWGRSRYADMLITLQWLYEFHPDGNEDVLLQCMQRIRDHGSDWAGYYTKENYQFIDLDLINIDQTTRNFQFTHGVNVGEGLKTMAVDFRHTHNETLLQTQRDAIDWTFQYHGAASGTILADEREAGLGPNRGSELCTAVETMYSLSYLYAAMGDNNFADRCELAAYNALPVSIAPDNWSRSYIAIPNQPWAQPVHGQGQFWNVGDEGATFGPDPNYPCCTVNHPQGLPKFLSASYVAVKDFGLAHALLSPSVVDTILPNGANIMVSCKTEYPFAESLEYTITADKAFSLFVRIPAWSQGATATLNSQTVDVIPDQQTGLAPFALQAGTTSLTLTLNPKIVIQPRTNNTVAITHGSLLYALDVGNSLNYLDAGKPYAVPPQVKTLYITPTLPWNFAIDPATATFVGTANGAGMPTWGYQTQPGSIAVRGCQINWGQTNGLPSLVPADRTCVGNVTDLILRPYGGLKIHMAEFPTVALQ